MTVFDYAIAAIIAISFFIGIYRGFFRELFSLIAWLASLWCSWTYYSAIVIYLTDFVPESFIVPVAVSCLFFIFLAVFTVLARILEVIFNFIGLGLLNRPLGAAFGTIRGGAIGFLVLSLLMISPFKDKLWLRQSLTHYYFSKDAAGFLDALTKGRYGKIPLEFLQS